MICSDSVNLFNLIAECESLVDDQLDELVWCGLSSEELELFIDGFEPDSDDTGRDL